jgi:hypothetical protein
MLYRGIRFSVRQSIAPGVWIVAIHPEGEKEISQGVTGTRKHAEATAHNMIERLLKRNPPPVRQKD